MSIDNLLKELESRGLFLKAAEGRLLVHGDLEMLTEELRVELGRRKAEFLALLEHRNKPVTAVQATPAPETRHAPFELTDIQQAYWFGRQGFLPLGDVSTHYYGEFDCDDLALNRLESALNRLIERHDMLRAIIDPDGRQRVLPETDPYRIIVHDVAACTAEEKKVQLESTRAELSREVRPADKWPLFRVEASLIGSRRIRLHISVDLLIVDFLSLSILARDWRRLYDGLPLEPMAPVTFRDCVLAINRLATERFDDDRAYWQGRIAALPPAPALPVETASEPDFVRFERRLDQAAWSRFQKHAGQARVSGSAALLASFAEVISLWSNTDHFSISVTQFNRPPVHPDIMSIVGDFTGVSLTEIRRNPEATFEERAQAIQFRLLSDMEHALYSGTRVARDLGARSGNPAEAVFPVVFTSAVGIVSRDQNKNGFDLFGREVFGISQTPQVSLDHVVIDDGGELRFRWDVLEDRFPPGMIRDMFESYTSLLYRLAEDASAWTTALRADVPDEHIHERQEANDTFVERERTTLDSLVMAAAQAAPDAPAVVASDHVWSYCALLAAARTVARRLEQTGVDRGAPVAVRASPKWQVPALLAVLLSGRPYVPLSTTWPVQRIKEVVAEAEAAAVICESEYGEFKTLDIPVVVAGDAVDPPDTLDSAPMAAISPDDVAYIIFTSGSTGRPKGVTVTHSAAVNTILDINSRFGVGPTDRTIGISDLAFDLSVYDVFGTLAAGACLVIADEQNNGRRNPFHWRDLIEKHEITIWNTVPALMEMLVEACGDTTGALSSLRTIMLSGDWIPVKLPKRIKLLAPEAQVHSLGGATEAAIWSIFHTVTPDDEHKSSIPYGKPLANQRWQVLSADLQPCPRYVFGDLYIAGIGLARGYWRQPELTAASFIRHPVSGERLYRTGDLGRYVADGVIELLGREDGQVKIGGYRIETGEIEAKMLAIPGIESASVVVMEDNGQRRSLGAAIVSRSGGLQMESITAALREQLPHYMIPRRIQLVPELPLTSNGKVDRRAVAAALQAQSQPTESGSASGFDMERQLLEVVRQVTGTRIRVDGNFFEEGLTSLDLVKVHAELEKVLNRKINPVLVFEYPNVRRFAQFLTSEVVRTRISSMPDRGKRRRERLARVRKAQAEEQSVDR